MAARLGIMLTIAFVVVVDEMNQRGFPARRITAPVIVAGNRRRLHQEVPRSAERG